MAIDLQKYYGKLANNQAVSEDEIVDLLKAMANMQKTAAYLAECHAATLESLPKSASKSTRSRFMAICEAAAKGLRGDNSGIRFPNGLDVAAERCDRAVRDATPLINPPKA